MSSLENGLKILSLIAEDRAILRVSEVCRELDIPKASVSRLLRTLADFHLLERDDRDSSYVAGGLTLDLARAYLARHGLMDLVEDAVIALVEEFGFTGHAGIIVGDERVLLVARQGSFPLQHIAAVSERRPAFQSIIGRAILARAPDADILAQLRYQAPDETRHGFSGHQILAEVSEIRRTRISQSLSLMTPGIGSVGAAVADPGRGEIMGFCLSYPSAAADEDLRKRMAEAIFRHASIIGTKLRDPHWTSDPPP
ncbi:IclR family transcriptional regulator [Hyphomicrobiales bacterium]|nr:IclR family transcriptional regulator [Hyphomicrobiales bacterium]CAH1672227.1 IclR family transcriptional regulator [Hyphomicrobiales bacterium]